MTQNGKRCKNRIREEEKYCHLHQDCDERKSSVKSVRKSPIKKGSVKKQEEEELSRAFRELKVESKIRNSPRNSPEDEYEPGSTRRKSPYDEYEPGSVRKSPNSPSLRASEKLFSGGFLGIENIIASYVAGYYQVKVTLVDVTNGKKSVRKVILAVQDEVLNEYFLQKYQINNLFIETLIEIKYPNSISQVEYKEIEYRDIKNKESIIFLDIYDMATLFTFIEIPREYYAPDKFSAFDYKIFRELIDSIKSKNYVEYNNLLKKLNPKMVHKVLPYVPIDDIKLTTPLFIPAFYERQYGAPPIGAQNPIIFRYDAMYPEADSEKKHIIYKFIIEVLIETIKNNNSRLCEIIINRLFEQYLPNKILIEYCMKIAEEYNREIIFEILSNKRRRYPSD
jgi:hypothetical protein